MASSSEDGFSVVEVLAALVILGVSAATLLGILSTATNRHDGTWRRSLAESLAQSLMDDAERSPPHPDSQSGHADPGLDWTITTQADQRGGALITVKVTWPQGQISLQGLRLKSEMPPS